MGLAHYRAAETARKYHNRIGIPNAMITAFVATSIFATLNEGKVDALNEIDFSDPVFWVRVVTGLFAVLAAVLAALQTFLRLSDRAEKHQNAGARYWNVRSTIDLFLLKCSSSEEIDREDAIKQIEEIINTLKSLSEESPLLTEAQYLRGKGDFDSNHTESKEGDSVV